MTHHQPVLLKEVIHYLAPQPGEQYLDGTVGGGGHTRAILQAARPSGMVLGLDRDPLAIGRLTEELVQTEPNLRLATASYAQTVNQLALIGWSGVDGALLDLGLSSLQLDDPDRGMSFRLPGPLDLRFNQSVGLPATTLMEKWSEADLTIILEKYGELHHGRTLAHRLKNFGPIRTTDDLKAASELAHPRRLAQLFQALRIATNDELTELADGLTALWSVLRPQGRLVILSFHSLEDRLVKRFFLARAHEGVGCLITKKVVVASHQERQSQPRSRSAKLRAIVKI